jgi:hypothetical protein
MKVLLFSIVVLLSSSFAMADCPVDETDADAIDEVIRTAGQCYEAAELARSCAWGSSIDVGFAGAAKEICDGSRPKLSPKAQGTYDFLIGECRQKYVNEVGSMYLSANAYCALGVA